MLRIECSGCRVQGSGLRVQGPGSRVEGAGSALARREVAPVAPRGDVRDVPGGRPVGVEGLDLGSRVEGLGLGFTV